MHRSVTRFASPATIALVLVVSCGPTSSDVTDIGPEVLNHQVGSASLGPEQAEVTVSVIPVNPERTLLLYSLRTDGNEPRGAQAAGRITSDTALTFSRELGTGAPEIFIVWYLIEFVEGVRVQRGYEDILDADTAVTIEEVDLTKSFPVIHFSQPGMIFDQDNLVRAELTDATTLTFSASTAPAGRVAWQVVEYSHATVHQGSVDMAEDVMAVNATATLDAAGGQCWLLYNYSAGPADPAVAAPYLVSGSDTGDGTLLFDRAVGGAAISINWFLVEFTDDTTVQKGVRELAAAQNSSTIILEPVELTTSVPFGGHLGRGGMSSYADDDLPGVAWATYELIAEDQLVLTREPAGLASAELPWTVVEF